MIVGPHVHLRRLLFVMPTTWLFKDSFAVYCGYFACTGTAATEGWWETGRLHQPDPSSPHGQTQTVPREDRVSAQKLSELSVVSDKLALLPGCVRGEKCLSDRFTCTWHCLFLLCSKSSGNEWLTTFLSTGTNKLWMCDILLVWLYYSLKWMKIEVCNEFT